ncbi:CBS domain-containing protein [Rhynchospora pubera]|uniref:CBS domain-containing protein n=1 Tax=Rhynchospora pubera TaxID=906938 RepID=A0AAV8HV20_9POAL|nr:CBS domain-containing protein [Rhynchospora pubera]
MDRLSSTSSSSSRRMAVPGGCSPRSYKPESTLRKPPPSPMSRSLTFGNERTVKRLRLTKALTLPENTTVLEVCRRMAQRQVNAALLTDSNALLCGILTDKDITTRVIARELKLEETPVSKVMTRNPVFVLSDTLAVESLQRMVQGKFRHLPVVENGEVIALLDITKCLYDAIARMERASEKGKAIAAAVEGVEKSWGTPTSGCSSSFAESLRDQMFRPSLSTVVSNNSKAITVTLSDSVLTATKKMLEGRKSSVVVTVGNKPMGILTSRDILMRVISKDLSPESTPVEKVMTPNPECGTLDTPILDALRIMQEGKFLHLPIIDKDGNSICVIDVIDITHAAVSTVENNGGVSNEAAISLIQKFWDSAMSMPMDDDDNSSETSLRIASDAGGENKINRGCSSLSNLDLPNTFSFKLQDKRGQMHRFSSDVQTLTPLVTCILQRLSDDIDRHNLPQILYEDEDRDRVLITSDEDLIAAVEHAKLAGWKGLRLYLDYSGMKGHKKGRTSVSTEGANCEYAWAAAYSAVAAGAAFVVGLGIMAYIKRPKS